jgi:hypothetical protein
MGRSSSPKTLGDHRLIVRAMMRPNMVYPERTTKPAGEILLEQAVTMNTWSWSALAVQTMPSGSLAANQVS